MRLYDAVMLWPVRHKCYTSLHSLHTHTTLNVAQCERTPDTPQFAG